MSSYFTLTLDTTPPNIEIYAPTYSNRQSNNTITVVSNEKLSDFQDIYIIDHDGVRHDVIFSFDGDKTFTGNVVFSNYPIGMLTIYAQLKDTVNNMSNLASFNLTIITTDDSLMLDLTMSELSMNRIFSIGESSQTMSEKSMVKFLSEKQTMKTLSEKKKITTISDKN